MDVPDVLAVGGKNNGFHLLNINNLPAGEQYLLKSPIVTSLMDMFAITNVYACVHVNIDGVLMLPHVGGAIINQKGTSTL